MTRRPRARQEGVDLETIKGMLDEQSVLLNRIMAAVQGRTGVREEEGGEAAEPGDAPTIEEFAKDVLEAMSSIDDQSKLLEDIKLAIEAGGGEKAAQAAQDTADAVTTAASDIARAAAADRAGFRILMWIVLALAVPGALVLGLLAQASWQILP